MPVPVPVGNPIVPLVGAAQLPTSITVDIAAAVRELVKLPSTNLLGLKAASALAGASCQDGRPVLAGQRTVAA